MPLPDPRLALAPSIASDAFLLDLDGTLIEFAPTPDDVAVPEGLRALVLALAERASGAVAIVSGRALASIDRLLPDLDLPVAAEHGMVLRTPGSPPAAGRAPSAALDKAAERIAGWAAGRAGLAVERKPHAVALHWRRRPDLAEAAQDAAERIAAAAGADIVLQAGRMVAELRLAGPDKGSAVAGIMGLPAFAGRRPIAFGDDWTDEAAFAAASRLGGGGVIVGDQDRPTAAAAALPAPAAVRRLLGELAWR